MTLQKALETLSLDQEDLKIIDIQHFRGWLDGIRGVESMYSSDGTGLLVLALKTIIGKLESYE